MRETAIQNGFIYSHTCNCSVPGHIYKRGPVELKITHNRFVITIGDKKVTGKPNELQSMLDTYAPKETA